MRVITIGAILAAAVLIVVNAIITWTLWRSPLFERRQKVVQTVIIWLLPGSLMAVRHIIHEPHHGRDSGDPTIDNEHVSIDVSCTPHGHGDDTGHA
jgi:hypothetical protein